MPANGTWQSPQMTPFLCLLRYWATCFPPIDHLYHESACVKIRRRPNSSLTWSQDGLDSVVGGAESVTTTQGNTVISSHFSIKRKQTNNKDIINSSSHKLKAKKNRRSRSMVGLTAPQSQIVESGVVEFS
jgi:hypothetical protein